MANMGGNNPEKQAAKEKTPDGREPRFQDIFIDPKYIKEFSYLSETELRKCKALTKSDEAFTFTVGYKNRREAIRKQHGERAIQSQPLVSLLFVKVLKSEDESLAIYGTINVEFVDQRGKMVVHQLYMSNEDDAQFVGTKRADHPSSFGVGTKRADPSFPRNKRGDLIFNGPSSSTVRDQTCMPLLPSKSIKVEPKLFQKTGDVFANTSLELDVEIMDAYYGGTKYEYITCNNEGFEAILWYMVVPFGVTCCIDISVYFRHSTGEGDSLSVSGNIAARYGCRYDEFIDMSYLLFDKKGEESETVDDKGGSLKLSRCWVAVPAYSSLLVTMDLSVHQNKAGTEEDQKLAKAKFEGSVELFPEQGGWSDETTVLDDYIITTHARWYSPDYHWPSITGEDADTQSEESDDDDVDDNESPPSNTILNPYEPLPFLAMEIYSVFIGSVEDPPRSVLGTIKVVSKDEIICSIYDRDDGARNWTLSSERGQLIPVSDGFRVFWKYAPMELKIDIKDDADYLAIKGYGDWETTHSLDTDLGYGKQLCSVIRGKHGFVAVHYSIFSTGLVATIEVILKSKAWSGFVDVDSMVRGSLIAQYSHFEYSSKYKKDCYRILLWRGSDPGWYQTETDPDSSDHGIPLARSRIFVPSNSSLLLEVDLLCGKNYDNELSLVKEIAVGIPYEDCDSLNSDYSFCIKVDWQPMKIE